MEETFSTEVVLGENPTYPRYQAPEPFHDAANVPHRRMEVRIEPPVPLYTRAVGFRGE